MIEILMIKYVIDWLIYQWIDRIIGDRLIDRSIELVDRLVDRLVDQLIVRLIS
jgi:hypothetical protein